MDSSDGFMTRFLCDFRPGCMASLGSLYVKGKETLQP